MASAPSVEGAHGFLAAHAPFSGLGADLLDFVARRLREERFAAGEALIGPGPDGPARAWVIREGVVDVVAGAPAGTGAEAGGRLVRQLAPGDVFPVAALLAARAPADTYRAATDCVCWTLEKSDFDALAQRSPEFLAFCRRRLGTLLDLSERALRASYAERAAHRREMSASLGSVLRREPVTCGPDESIRAAFERMEAESVGSVIVLEPGTPTPVPAGIFTRQDVIGRVVLAGRSLDEPVRAVMSAPVQVLDADASVADAMLAMAEHAIRHLPVVRDGALAGIVTERDLFALRRRSLHGIGDAIRAADGVDRLCRAAGEIRAWSRDLVAQGASAAFVTRLISRLNDQLTARLVALVATRRGLALETVCWLAMGSEGREEQTIATDQDNGLILGPACDASREALRSFAREVNEGLDACGYPLCKGEIMASNPRWCVSLDEWQSLFDAWIERGDPESLLHANIFFDFRPIAGNAGLARALRARVTQRARRNARFLKQMCDNALSNAPPASWTGGGFGKLFRREQVEIDLKLHGTVPFVDGARLLALAGGVEATGTAQRLEAVAQAGTVPPDEVRDWIDAFQFLQSLRLRIQHAREIGDERDPNRIDTSALSALDRRALREAFGQARRLQQRLALDYPG